jgi:hypothetical protein
VAEGELGGPERITRGQQFQQLAGEGGVPLTGWGQGQLVPCRGGEHVPAAHLRQHRRRLEWITQGADRASGEAAVEDDDHRSRRTLQQAGTHLGVREGGVGQPVGAGVGGRRGQVQLAAGLTNPWPT